jgi:hypothetical protein
MGAGHGSNSNSVRISRTAQVNCVISFSRAFSATIITKNEELWV